MSDALSAGEIARVAAEVLGRMAFPALVLEVPSERIVAASPAAETLLDPAGGIVVGHLFQDFTSDQPARGFDLFAGGRLNGFETFRVLRRDGDDLKVRMWIRLFDDQPSSNFVVVVIVPEVSPTDIATAVDREDAPAVIGTTDASLTIDHISGDAEALFELPVSDLLGESLLALVAPDDVQTALAALSEASATQIAITLHVHVRSGSEGPALHCEVVILPLEPPQTCAFIFLPLPDGTAIDPVSAPLSTILLRVGRGAELAHLVRGVFRGVGELDVPGVQRLTTRELQIVTLLLEGDRAPAIAAKLHLSQSTVRNHLAAVFAKLNVTSQQQLLNLFRRI